MKTVKIAIAISFCLSIILFGCKKKEESGQGKMQVRLTDAPAAYDHVFVEIVGLEVHMMGGWVSLMINPGVYDLLELQNGVDTVLAPPQVIPIGQMSQMRLKLGSNNYVVDTTGTVIPLSVPSGETSG